MRKIQIEIDQPEIEVNGHVFKVKEADVDILDTALQMQAEFSKLNPTETDKIIKAINEVRAYIDKILGEGALAKIADGKPIGIEKAVKIMTIICKEIVAQYSEAINDEYDIQPEPTEE